MQIKNQKEQLVIEIKYGGLGDHLFFSHIPRIAKEIGIKKVLISAHSKFRNSEIYDLVWKQNPYVDGFLGVSNLVKVRNTLTGNILDNLMMALELNDGKIYHEPEIYCDIPINSDLADYVIYDPNYISYVGSIDANALKSLCKKHQVTHQMKFRGTGFPLGDEISTISAKNIFEYCQIIKSCKKFICLTSGSATLASAMGVEAIACFGTGQDPIFHHSKKITYCNVGKKNLAGYFESKLLKIKNLSRQINAK